MVARELAAGLGQRARALGEQLAASPEPWLARHLGVLGPGASPAQHEDYTRRAATAAAYREAAGITDPQQTVPFLPHRSHPELESMRLAAIRALEIRDEAAIIHSMSYGELEARVLDAERAQASAPPDVSRQLCLTAQAEADAWQQSANAATRYDQAEARNAGALASQLATERQQLEAGSDRREKWPTATAATRGAAAQAKAELDRRRRAATPEPGDPRPRSQTPRAGELLSQAVEAARRITAERQARADYAARLERESQVQLELSHGTQALHDREMEP